jgi:lysophospholipase
MELFEIEGNPAPVGATVGTVITADGVRLRYARWRPVGQHAQGTVCLLQGRGETIEKYFETIGDLRDRGFGVAILDWRGQGGSERRLRNRTKGHVDSFDEYDRDLEAFMQQVVLPDCPPPHFALAHSTGALVCLRATRSGQASFTRLVLVSPLVGLGPSRPSQPNVFRIAAFMTAIGFGEMTIPGDQARSIEQVPFDGNRLTGDPARYQRTIDIVTKLPQVSVGAPTFGWLYAACRAMRDASDLDFGPAIRVPSLVVSGALDRVVSLPAAEALAGALRAGGQVLIPGARHEILMERDSIRQQFWAAFTAFVPGGSRRS